MELKDVRSAIRKYPHIEKVNERELSITFESTNQKYHFTGIYNIFKFFHDQHEKWQQNNFDDIDNIFGDSKSFFENAVANFGYFKGSQP